MYQSTAVEVPVANPIAVAAAEAGSAVVVVVDSKVVGVGHRMSVAAAGSRMSVAAAGSRIAVGT